MVNGYSISQELIDWLFSNVQKGSTILELGSGEGTGILAERFKMHSIEHDKFFLNKYKSNYIYAPIHNGWYDYRKLQNLPQYDVLLIDAPPGYIGRMGILKHWDLFDWSKIIIVDDTHRKAEQELAKKIYDKIKDGLHDVIQIQSKDKSSNIYL